MVAAKKTIINYLNFSLSFKFVERIFLSSWGLETLTVYTDGFMLIAQYSVVAGLLVLVASPFIKKLMGNVH